MKNCYVSLFSTNNEFLKEMILINTKCLIDDKIQRVVYIDNNRLKDELIYQKYYGNTFSSKSFLSILTPLILANTNKQKASEEVLNLVSKFIKYLKKDDEIFYYLISANIYNSILNDIIKNKNIKYEEVLQNAKEVIINMNISMESFSKLEIIKFSKLKIETIKEIDNYINQKKSENINLITNLLNIIYSIFVCDIEFFDDDLNLIKKSILSTLGEKFDSNINNIDFVLSMADYLFKLKNYSVEKKLYNQKSDPRYLVNLNEKSEVFDFVLGKIFVESKVLNENILYITLKSKSGTYVMKFKKNN